MGVAAAVLVKSSLCSRGSIGNTPPPRRTIVKLVGTQLGRREAFVCFGKYFSGVLDIEGLLSQRPRIPFTSGHGEEIAAVDVDGCRDLIERISHGMDYRFTKRNGLFKAERLYT